MSTSRIEGPPAVFARNVQVTGDRLVVDLDDGRTLSVPLSWYPRLAHASASERSHWELIGRGLGIHWPDLDEDLSVDVLIDVRPVNAVAIRPDLKVLSLRWRRL